MEEIAFAESKLAADRRAGKPNVDRQRFVRVHVFGVYLAYVRLQPKMLHACRSWFG